MPLGQKPGIPMKLPHALGPRAEPVSRVKEKAPAVARPRGGGRIQASGLLESVLPSELHLRLEPSMLFKAPPRTRDG